MAAALELIVFSIDLLTGWLTAVLQGWLFALSPRFRRETYARWRGQPQMNTMTDVLSGLFGFLSSLALIVWTVAYVVIRVF
jgi:hypothetical protein